MKLLLENWRKYLVESEADNKLWIIAGPPAAGKTVLMRKVEALEIPNLIVQDIDYIPAWDAAQPDFLSLAPEDQHSASTGAHELIRRATPKMNAGIDDFIAQNAEKDIFLVGIAWMIPELPFEFPENAERIYLYRDPIDIVQSRADRVDGGLEALISSPEDLKKAIADIEKDYQILESRGWKRMLSDNIISLVKSSYAEEQNETPT